MPGARVGQANTRKAIALKRRCSGGGVRPALYYPCIMSNAVKTPPKMLPMTMPIQNPTQNLSRVILAFPTPFLPQLGTTPILCGVAQAKSPALHSLVLKSGVKDARPQPSRPRRAPRERSRGAGSVTTRVSVSGDRRKSATAALRSPHLR